MAYSVGAWGDQRSLPVDPLGLSYQNLVFQFYLYLLFTLTKIGFPTRRHGAKPRLLQNSIAPVEVLNQSPEKGLATDWFLSDFHKRGGALTNFIPHKRAGKIYIDPDAEDNELDAVGGAGRFGQNSRELLAVDQNVVGPFDHRRPERPEDHRKIEVHVRRRNPASAQTPSTLGLLFGDHHFPLRRSLFG